MIRMKSVKLKIAKMKMIRRRRVMKMIDDDMTCTFPIAVDFFSAPQPLLKPEDSP